MRAMSTLLSFVKIFACCLIFFSTGGFSSLQALEKKAPLFAKQSGESFSQKIVVIDIGMEDLSNKPRYAFIRRMVARAQQERAKAIVFNLNTPGGLAWETSEFLMEDLARIQIPTYSFVNPNAVSAGALIAMGTDEIYMARAAAIGAAGIVTPGQEMEKMQRAKAESYLVAAVCGVAKAKGHDPHLVSAMMKLDFEYAKGSVKVGKGELLSLDAQQATEVVDGKPLLAKGIVNSVEELLAAEGLSQVPIVWATPTGMEKISFWVASFSGILILIGIGGAYFEMKTPGFGIGGGISLLAFGIFFFGNYLAGNMAGYGLLALFIVGILLIIVEFVLLPGLLFPGILGGILVIGSLLFAMVDANAFSDNALRNWQGDGVWDFLDGPSFHLAIGIVGSTVLMLLLMYFLPQIPLVNRLVLSNQLAQGDGKSVEGKKGQRVGKKGVALTDLRPVGRAEIEGELLEVVAYTGFIESGSALLVYREEGMRILVKPDRTEKA